MSDKPSNVNGSFNDKINMFFKIYTDKLKGKKLDHPCFLQFLGLNVPVGVPDIKYNKLKKK